MSRLIFDHNFLIGPSIRHVSVVGSLVIKLLSARSNGICQSVDKPFWPYLFLPQLEPYKFFECWEDVMSQLVFLDVSRSPAEPKFRRGAPYKN